MKVTQNWVGFIDRSYQQIKQSMLNRLSQNNTEITDYSEGNPLIVLISIFSGMGEVINLYIDATARECFLGTLRKYSSALKIIKQTDYRVKAVVAPNVDLTFTLILTSSGLPTAYPSGAIDIPLNTEVDSDQNSIPFISQEAGTFRPGDTIISLPFKSYTPIIHNNLGTTDGSVNQSIILPVDYMHGTLSLLLGSDSWVQYTSLGYMTSITKGFIVDIMDDGNPYIIFGDGVNGLIPGSGITVFGDYKTSVGILGNLSSNTISKLATTISLPTGYELAITNPDYSSGGSDIEGLVDIRRNAPKDLRTLNRAVTVKDYTDIALLCPGVGFSEVVYCCCCGVFIDLYVGPKTRGIATSVLINDLGLFFSDKRIIGRRVLFHPCGITRVWLDLGIVAANSKSITQTTSAVILKLDNDYGYNASAINRNLQPADFINSLKALAEVENVSINRMYLEPYVRPLNTNTTPLSITWTNIHSAITINYRLKYDFNSGSPRFLLYRNNIFYTFIDIATPYSDGALFGFTIFNSGLYIDGMEWAFKLYPSYPEVFSNYELVVDDNTIPIIDVDFNNLIGGLPTIFTNISVTSSITNSTCLTNC